MFKPGPWAAFFFFLIFSRRSDVSFTHGDIPGCGPLPFASPDTSAIFSAQGFFFRPEKNGFP
jgi:hypothetical protein